MKRKRFLALILIIFLPLVLLHNAFAQNYTTLNLPEGAKARLGKGTIEDIAIAYTPGGELIAVASSIGVWLYHTAMGPKPKLLTGNISRVSSVAFSPDGATVATGSRDGTVRLWDVPLGATRGTFRKIFRGHTAEVSHVAFSPDGFTIATGSRDGTVRLWDVGTGKLWDTLRGHIYTGSSVAFSPDGRILATNVGTWNVEPHALPLRGASFQKAFEKNARFVAFSPDGRTLAIAESSNIAFWDVGTATYRTTKDHFGHELRYRIPRSGSFAFSPNGGTLATGGGSTVELWNITTKPFPTQWIWPGRRPTLEHPGFVSHVAFRPDGNTIVSVASDFLVNGAAQAVRFWDVTSGTIRGAFTGHTAGISSLAFSRNGNTLASGNQNTTVDLWSVRTRIKTGTLHDPDRGHPFFVSSVAFSPDGYTIASGGHYGSLLLWNVVNRTLQRTLTRHFGQVRALSFSPDGHKLASGDDRTIRLWNLTRNAQKQVVIVSLQDTLTGHIGSVSSVAFSPDGSILASGSDDGTVRLWDVTLGTLRETLEHSARVSSVAFSPDGQTLASGASHRVLLWDVRTATYRDVHERLTVTSGHRGGIHSVAFSPDGRTLASGSGDHTVRLWDVETGLLEKTLTGHKDWVNSVAFSPNGMTLASGSRDGTVLLWDIEPAEPLPLADDVNVDGTVNISEPGPPSAAVRETFNLDPFYEQWIDVEGLPVVASAKVSPYAVKEAAWLIRQMIGHRQDLLQALAKNNVRFAVMAHNELTTQIPEHSDLQPDYYWDRRARGLGPTPARPAVSCGEENLLNYQGDPYFNENILVHEFAHAIHHMGLNTVDPSFDARLNGLYDAAVEKGLWENTYAITNKAEYWAEGAQSWFDTNRANDDQHNHVDTRDKLKAYDPALAALLTEVFGDGDWRYTQAVTRTHLGHLQGFNPEDSPKFEWPAESVALTESHQQLKNPDSDGGGKWVDLKRRDPSLLPSLTSDNSLTETGIIFVNLTEAEIAYYWVDWAGEERHYGNVALGDVVYQHTYVGHVWLVKDADGGNLAVFRAEERTGRALLIKAELKTDVNGDGTVNIQDLVAVAAAFGATGENPADVNGDGTVNIQDLVAVAAAFGEAAAAPTAYTAAVENLIPTEVAQWLQAAQHANLTDPTFQRGVEVLRHLLVLLTPKETALLANYPNPFNPETWIPYQLSAPGDVRIEIHAIDSSLVRVLSLGHQPAGIYQNRSRAAYWNGRNQLGEPVASGVYFYTLSTESTRDSVTAGDFTATRKMLIRK